MFKSQILRNSGEIEKPHVKFCKRILGVHAKATNITVNGELGKTPLIIQIAKLVVNRFESKVHCSQTHWLVKQKKHAWSLS